MPALVPDTHFEGPDAADADTAAAGGSAVEPAVIHAPGPLADTVLALTAVIDGPLNVNVTPDVFPSLFAAVSVLSTLHTTLRDVFSPALLAVGQDERLHAGKMGVTHGVVRG